MSDGIRDDSGRYFIVHGHFYQPPRENPYLGRIDRQDSAHPHHDWNERVSSECYGPNGRSRILNQLGEIEEVHNNYGHLSFNFGPTLLSWMEAHDPEAYHQVIAGDRIARERLKGAGSAMAQVYNHVIMTLVDDLDRRTQIRWGIADFKHRFGRSPRGMWLAETAINHKVAETLMEEGIEFTILSPYQADQVAPIGSASWRDVSSGDIDVHRPYRIFHGKGLHDRKSMAIFFYHAEMARRIAFEGLLTSSDALADSARRSLPGSVPRFTMVATDGESFGHHKPFGDMCLASVFGRKLVGSEVRIVTPEYVLDQMPIRDQVRLKRGEGALGTAWSCAHGVGRWMRDCGCHTGGSPGWNQKWREPLYRGLTALSRELKRIYYSVTSKYFRDPWAARDRYIDVILAGHSLEAREAFLAGQLKTRVSAPMRQDLFALLESQKYAMFSFTSCGWFFAEISGLEPVQNLRYASMAIELAGKHARRDLHELLMSYLQQARSNVPEHRDGAKIYQKLVLEHSLNPPRLLSREILARISGKYESLKVPLVGHRIRRVDRGVLSDREPSEGIAELEDRTTGTRYRYRFNLVPTRPVGADLKLTLLPPGKRMLQAPPMAETVHWTELDTDLKDRLMVEGLTEEARDIGQTLQRALRSWEGILTMAARTHSHLPRGIWEMVQRGLEWELEGFMTDDEGEFPEDKIKFAVEALERARELNIKLNSPVVGAGLSRTARRHFREVRRLIPLGHVHPGEIHDHVNSLRKILSLETQYQVKLARTPLENDMWRVIREEVPAWLKVIGPGPGGRGKTTVAGVLTQLEVLGRHLNFASVCFSTWKTKD